MVSLFESKTIQTVVSEQQQQHDLEKAHLFLTITHQLWQLQLALDLGQMNEGMVSDLHDVLLTTHILLQMGIPTLPLYSLEAVRLCRAETFKTIARGYEALAERDRALSYAQRAARLYHSLQKDAGQAPINEAFQPFHDLLTEVLHSSLRQSEISSRLFQQLITAGIQTAYSYQQWNSMLCWMEIEKKGGYLSTEERSFVLKDMQAQLAEDEGVLSYYWLEDDQLLLVTIDAEEILCRRQWISNSDQQLIAEVTQRMVQGQPIAQTYLDCLSALLLPLSPLDSGSQAQRSLLQRKRRLLISTPDDLQQIPFQGLPWEGECLIQHFALAHIPTLSSLSCTYGSVQKGPVLSVTTQHLTHADAELYQEQLTTLYESDNIPTTILTSSENMASVETLDLLADIGALQHYHYLHFATQGKKTPSGSSVLLLQDTVLDSSKIVNWRLNAELVILEVNSDSDQPGTTMHSESFVTELQDAFVAAGVKQIVFAVGNVPEAISGKIIAGLHAYLAQGESIEIALQKAQQDSLQVAQMRGEQHLHQWAPYVLFSVGRAL
jgi:CHAT domain-containing protein